MLGIMIKVPMFGTVQQAADYHQYKTERARRFITPNVHNRFQPTPQNMHRPSSYSYGFGPHARYPTLGREIRYQRLNQHLSGPKEIEYKGYGFMPKIAEESNASPSAEQSDEALELLTPPVKPWMEPIERIADKEDMARIRRMSNTPSI